MTYHIFLSYARVDDAAPVNADGEGWITAFDRELKRRHLAYTGRELELFFDRSAIGIGDDWRRRLGEGIRQSKLFLAFLTPNYLASENCLWEWNEYLRREHSRARGDDGVTPIFFVAPDELIESAAANVSGWLADLQRRNRTAHCEFQPWFSAGPDILRDLDAADRLAELKETPRDQIADVRTLAERLAGLDARIATRLDRIALADLAPGNVTRSHEHFVGRHRELSDLHGALTAGGARSGGRGSGGYGLIAATFSPGGLGKTAIARQYAHAYAEWYAAGGTWEVPCEGESSIGLALLRLADSAAFRALAFDRDPATGAMTQLAPALEISEAERADDVRAAEAILTYLEGVTVARAAVLREQLRRHPERHSPADLLEPVTHPRALLILDNVSDPGLLTAREIARLRAAEWLEIIVTTRLDPSEFAGGDRTFRHIEIGVLPEADALDLLRDFQPACAFADAGEEAAAREIVRALGGYTLAVELVGAYLGDRGRQGYTPSMLLAQLRQEGLDWVDGLADLTYVDREIRHSEARDASERRRQNRIGTIVQWSLDQLDPAARTMLEFASLLMPDAIPSDWLVALTFAQPDDPDGAMREHALAARAAWRQLHGLRLLHPTEPLRDDEAARGALPAMVRIHRILAGHVAARNAAPDACAQQLHTLITHRARSLEQSLMADHAGSFLTTFPGLRDQVEFLVQQDNAGSASDAVLRAASLIAGTEGEHGSLARAIGIAEKVQARLAESDAHDPSLPSQRLRSLHLSVMAELLARRGQAGDADLAITHAEESVALRIAAQRAAPDSESALIDLLNGLLQLAPLLAPIGDDAHLEEACATANQINQICVWWCTTDPESEEASLHYAFGLVISGELLLRVHARDNEPKALESALEHLRRAVAYFEARLKVLPKSADVAQKVTTTLDRLANALLRRGSSADIDEAAVFAARALELSRNLWLANPESASLRRDLSVALETASRVFACNPDLRAGALDLQERALSFARLALQQNPRSFFAQRFVVSSLYLTAERAARAGEIELLKRCVLECIRLIDGLVSDGTPLDPTMQALHGKLNALLDNSASSDEA